MEKYIGTKIIVAEPEVKDGAEGYKVVYEDGYVSWSPKDVFEKAYKTSGNLTFGHALEYLKMGYKVYREGWNGKDMYVQLNGAKDFEFSELLPFFTIKNVKNSFNTWVPSVSDILATDWCIKK